MNIKESKRILLDFDGTCLTSENYPGIGKDIGAVPVLKKLIENNHKLILWTRRNGIALENAKKWFEDNQIELADTNPKYSSKIFYDLIIDDRTLNVPLKYPKEGKPYVNWIMAKMYLQKLKLL